MSTPYAERPAPDRQRFLAALAEWRSGEVTPGTTMQTLKRGGFDLLLADAGPAAPQPLVDAWDAWERGHAPPAETLARLDDAGLQEFLEAAP